MRVAQHSHGAASPSHFSHRGAGMSPVRCGTGTGLISGTGSSGRHWRAWTGQQNFGLCVKATFFSASNSSAGSFNCLILAWETLHEELLRTMLLGRVQAHLGTWSALGAWWPWGTWWTLKQSKQNRLGHDQHELSLCCGDEQLPAMICQRHSGGLNCLSTELNWHSDQGSSATGLFMQNRTQWQRVRCTAAKTWVKRQNVFSWRWEPISDGLFLHPGHASQPAWEAASCWKQCQASQGGAIKEGGKKKDFVWAQTGKPCTLKEVIFPGHCWIQRPQTTLRWTNIFRLENYFKQQNLWSCSSESQTSIMSWSTFLHSCTLKCCYT